MGRSAASAMAGDVASAPWPALCHRTVAGQCGLGGTIGGASNALDRLLLRIVDRLGGGLLLAAPPDLVRRELTGQGRRDLRTEQQQRRGDEEPEHQHDDGAEGSVRGAVVGDVARIPTECSGGDEPAQREHDGADGDPAPRDDDARRVAVQDRDRNRQHQEDSWPAQQLDDCPRLRPSPSRSAISCVSIAPPTIVTNDPITPTAASSVSPTATA